jgi:LacI family transcriptional regulator
MKDVAALAKVSIKTVSRVVNGEAGVTPGLARRVMAASERLDYRHNLTASSLRRSDGRSATIGILLVGAASSHRGCGGAAGRAGPRQQLRRG